VKGADWRNTTQQKTHTHTHQHLHTPAKIHTHTGCYFSEIHPRVSHAHTHKRTRAPHTHTHTSGVLRMSIGGGGGEGRRVLRPFPRLSFSNAPLASPNEWGGAAYTHTHTHTHTSKSLLDREGLVKYRTAEDTHTHVHTAVSTSVTAFPLCLSGTGGGGEVGTRLPRSAQHSLHTHTHTHNTIKGTSKQFIGDGKHSKRQTQKKYSKSEYQGLRGALVEGARLHHLLDCFTVMVVRQRLQRLHTHTQSVGE